MVIQLIKNENKNRIKLNNVVNKEVSFVTNIQFLDFFIKEYIYEDLKKRPLSANFIYKKYCSEYEKKFPFILSFFPLRQFSNYMKYFFAQQGYELYTRRSKGELFYTIIKTE
jgi:hypothetical protein